MKNRPIRLFTFLLAATASIASTGVAYAQTYSGTYTCQATNEAPAKPGFSVTAELVVKNGQAQLRRGSKNYEEVLDGRVKGSNLTLQGTGKFFDKGNPWTAQLVGKLDANTYKAVGGLSNDKGKFRDCEVMLNNTAPAAAAPEQKVTVPTAQEKPQTVVNKPSPEPVAPVVQKPIAVVPAPIPAPVSVPAPVTPAPVPAEQPVVASSTPAPTDTAPAPTPPVVMPAPAKIEPLQPPPTSVVPSKTKDYSSYWPWMAGGLAGIAALVGLSFLLFRRKPVDSLKPAKAAAPERSKAVHPAVAPVMPLTAGVRPENQVLPTQSLAKEPEALPKVQTNKTSVPLQAAGHATTSIAATPEQIRPLQNVVLRGLQPGHTLDQVKPKLEALLKATPTQVDQLIAVPGYVLKRGLPYDKALGYRNALVGAGVNCTLELEPDAIEPLEADLPETVRNVAPDPMTKNLDTNLGRKQSERFCPACGESVPAIATFCGACGHSLAATSKDTTAQRPALDAPPLAAEPITPHWQMRFTLIERAGGAKLPKIRDLVFGERRKVIFNWLAFFFSSIYYLVKGMWRKAISLTVLTLVIAIFITVVCSAFGFSVESYLWMLAPIIFGTRANVDYYKKVVHGENGWW